MFYYENNEAGEDTADKAKRAIQEFLGCNSKMVVA